MSTASSAVRVDYPQFVVEPENGFRSDRLEPAGPCRQRSGRANGTVRGEAVQRRLGVVSALGPAGDRPDAVGSDRDGDDRHTPEIAGIEREPLAAVVGVELDESAVARDDES